MTKTALVVGASGGIGGGIARLLAQQGWSILAQGRDPERLERIRSDIQGLGADCHTLTEDLTDPDQVAALAEQASARRDLQALVFSAGGGRAQDSGPGALAEWNRTLAAILHAPMQLTALTLPRMRQTGGHYLYIAGMYAKIGMPRMAAHCAGRHGLEGFAKALFEEVREDGVGLTLINPGFVYTGLTSRQILDPDKMIQIDDIAAAASMALAMPNRACVTELTVRPQRSPYLA